MKKALLSLLVIAVASISTMVLPLSASADSDDGSYVRGTVTDNGVPVAKAKVTVTCNGHVKDTKTRKSGAYSVLFARAKVCPVGSSVQVTATKGQSSGSSSGVVTADGAELNVAVVDVTFSVPEVGLFTGTAAVAGGGGALFTIRRRKLEQS